MIIRVLMKYLEHKDADLYLKAKETIKDCVRRNRNREKGYHSLTGSIQASVKQVVGVSYWRKAESYLSKMLVKRADEEADIDMLNQLDYELTSCSLIDAEDPFMADEGFADPSSIRAHWRGNQTASANMSTNTSSRSAAATHTPKRTLSIGRESPEMNSRSDSIGSTTAGGSATKSKGRGVCSVRKRRRIHGLL